MLWSKWQLFSGGYVFEGRLLRITCPQWQRLHLKSFQKLRNGLMIHRPGVVIALRHFAIELFQVLNLLYLLRAFSDYFEAQIVGEHDDDAHDLAAFRVRIHVGNKRPVDLE